MQHLESIPSSGNLKVKVTLEDKKPFKKEQGNEMPRSPASRKSVFGLSTERIAVNNQPVTTSTIQDID